MPVNATDRGVSSGLSTAAISLALTLAGCSGGGSSGEWVIPSPPSPNQPEQPALVTAATTSQQFATKGAAYASPSGSYDDFVISSPDLAADAQLDVRYNAETETYEVRVPDTEDWQAIRQVAAYPPPDDYYQYTSEGGDTAGIFDHRHGFDYSALLEWWTGTHSGFSAIGIATPSGAVPTTGAASYDGWLLGSSSETTVVGWEEITVPVPISGTIALSFDFGAGTMSGSIDPTLGSYALPPLSFADTVFSVGSTTFSGRFATALPGLNSFSGLFTGPHAEELIGNFAFPYQSPGDGSDQQAAGAFAARGQ